MFGLFRRRPHERAAYSLYTDAVRAARRPWFYSTLGVPDTLDGRFDLVGLHVFLLVDRLHREGAAGKALAQAVFDAMFADMDFNLREMGVGDMTVGKKVKQMMTAFHGRSTVYAAALEADDAAQGQAGLEAALARNVWRGEEPEGAAASLAGLMRRERERLGAVPVAAFVAGAPQFADPVLA